MTLYPNPAKNGNFKIAAPGLAGQQLKVSLTNMLGQLVYNTTMDAGADGVLTLEVPGLRAGVFVVTVTDGAGGVFIGKLMNK